MAWIPTVKMFKGSRQIKINADETIRYAREGWMREEEWLKEQNKGAGTSEVKTLEIPIKDDMPVNPDLSDLQVD